MRLSEIAEYMIEHHMGESLESEVVRGNHEKWYEESLIDPLMDEFWYHDLGLCGCNCPEDTKEAIRKYLHIRKDFHDKELAYEGVVRRYRTDLGIDEHSQVQYGVLQFMMYMYLIKKVIRIMAAAWAVLGLLKKVKCSWTYWMRGINENIRRISNRRS